MDSAALLHRRARSTTARARSSAGCCTTPRASSRTSCAAIERTSRRRGNTPGRPGAADRRPARRARAGHHHRRGLPLLRHAPPQVHHRRHARATSSTPATWSPAPPPRTSPSCSSTPATASSSSPAATPSSPPCWASRTSSWPSTRWTWWATSEEVFEAIRERVRRVGGQARRPRHPVHPHLARSTATTSSQRSLAMPWYQGPVAAVPPGARLHRLRPQPHRRPLPGAVGHPAADRRAPRLPRLCRPGRRGHRSGRATRSSCCPPGQAHAHQAHQHLRWRARGGRAADVGHHASSRTTSTSRRGDMICRPHNQPTVDPGASRRWSAG